MSGVKSLLSSLCDDFEIYEADLFSSREGPHAKHGIGVQEVVSWHKNIDVNPHYVLPCDRIALDQRGLILVGNLSEFGPEAARLARAAAYPTRFELVPAECGYEIVDLMHESRPTTIAKANEHVGLIYRGNSRGLPMRPMLLFFGTSPLGILAATRFAMHCGLADIPPPPGFPSSPIEALVPLQRTDGTALPAINDLGGVRVVCGEMEWDSRREEWVKSFGETRIRVLTRNGVARVIYVGKNRFEVTKSDFSRLLLLLIERSAKRMWTTIREAQLYLDGAINENRDRTINNRKVQIGNLSQNLLEKTKETPDGSPGYRINVPIQFIEQAG